MGQELAAFAGALVGMFAFMRGFLFLAGVRFTHWRQIVVAYVLFAIAATFIHAAGAADGGPPNYYGAIYQWSAAVLLIVAELLALRGRTSAALASRGIGDA